MTTNEQNRYVVAWEHQYSATDWDILGIELNVDGDQVVPFFAIASTGEVEARPDVAANGATKEWLAVWQRTAEAGDAIWAAAWKSGAVPGTRFPVAAVTFWNNRYPAVAADIPGYLIVYEGRAAEPTQYQHIYGRMWWRRLCISRSSYEMGSLNVRGAHGYDFPINPGLDCVDERSTQ